MIDQNEIHRKTLSNNVKERRKVVDQLKNNFAEFPDKKEVWDDLHRLTGDTDFVVRWGAVDALGAAFPHVPDKVKAWDDLHWLTGDTDFIVRGGAAYALGAAFPHVPDKVKAWDDLHRLTGDTDRYVRRGAANALGSAFPHVPDKVKAWDDLIRLTGDTDSNVRWGAAYALGSAFPHVTDKVKAWDDLHRLTGDTDFVVRWGAVDALGAAFPHVPDKVKAWDDLHRLTGDTDSDVRRSANHSLGRASIFKATETETEDEFRKAIENGIAFFEASSREAATYSNPARFCLPFYRSLYTVTFKKQEAETEVQNYLNEAKLAAEGSENKEKLLEAVENLAKALREAQRERDLNTMRGDLNTYRQYCDRAAALLVETAEKAPGATKLVRKGVPIIDRRIKELVEKIKSDATLVCQQSRGTPKEKIACTINQEVQKWLIGDQEQLTKNIDNIIFILKQKIPKIPENKDIIDKIREIRNEMDINKQYEILEIIIALIPTVQLITEKINEMEEKVDNLIVRLGPKVREEITINFGFDFLGSGIKHSLTIPLQEISYQELREDLEKLGKNGKCPSRLVEKVKDYLSRKKSDFKK